MENSNRASSLSYVTDINGNIPSTYSYSLPVESRGKQKTDEGVSHHQRCLSESLLMEEEPFWIEDLLSDPVDVVHKGHRRSASDSFAYLGAFAEGLYVNMAPDLKSLTQFSSDTTSISPNEKIHKASHESTTRGGSMSSGKHRKEESTSQNAESSSEKANNPQSKSSMSKAETKRAKQQSAHRSRVRKLQHISELERTVHALQVEESVVSAELEFIDQHNLILSMENRALMQRLDSLSQEFFIKHMEQEMLERELVRLQTLHQLQLHHHSNHLHSRSRDLLEGQFTNLSLSNNAVSSSRIGPTNRSVWIQ
ncbi:unnamed protein product [Cuscuta epithymum]|uniref:BZIP domain-containing protein n=1 Tax=Cuscuta epithymum TaxID=186058 RepID=A0AAV0ESV9_9ASTE|nr:unnamed protein product [Cuscuta epithymum]